MPRHNEVVILEIDRSGHEPNDQNCVHDYAVDTRVAICPRSPLVHEPSTPPATRSRWASKYAGAPVPNVAYTEEEHALWRLVAGELYAAYEGAAVEEYRRAAAELALPLDRLPQLAEVSKRLIASTGFRFEPVNGLLATREFWSYLAERRFPSTQYIRHASVPRYTPEPDVVHELLGHANALASPMFADLYAAFGHASSRIETEGSPSLPVVSGSRGNRVAGSAMSLGLRRGTAVVVRRDGAFRSHDQLLIFCEWADTYYDITSTNRCMFAPPDAGAGASRTFVESMPTSPSAHRRACNKLPEGTFILPCPGQNTKRAECCAVGKG